jgi:hypothetical protein
MMSQVSPQPHTFSTEISNPHTEHSYPVPTLTGFCFFAAVFFAVFFRGFLAAVDTFLTAAFFFGATFAVLDAVVFFAAVFLIAIFFLLKIYLLKLYQIIINLQEAAPAEECENNDNLGSEISEGF